MVQTSSVNQQEEGINYRSRMDSPLGLTCKKNNASNEMIVSLVSLNTSQCDFNIRHKISFFLFSVLFIIKLEVMVQNHLIDSLSERLAKDVHIFDNLLKLIPAKFYVMDKNDHIDSKFQHNKRKKAPKQAIKEATKKAKKAKLDPDNVKTVMDVQSEKAKQLKEEEEAKKEEEEEEEMSMEVDSSGFSGLDDSESIATESTSTSTQEPGKINEYKCLYLLDLVLII